MGTQSEFWYLNGDHLQNLLTSNNLEQLAYFASPKLIQKGDFIYFPNEKSNKIFFIISGRVKIGAYSDYGKEIIKAINQSGEIFGEGGLMGEEVRTEFAQAMDDVQYYVIPLVNLKDLMRKNSAVTMQVMRLIGQKLVKVQRRLESQVFRNARSRVIEFLRDLARDKGQRIGFEMLVRKFYTHQEIANLTGTSRQTVTTILNELRADNHIYFDRKKLLVRDLKQLGTLIN